MALINAVLWYRVKMREIDHISRTTALSRHLCPNQVFIPMELQGFRPTTEPLQMVITISTNKQPPERASHAGGVLFVMGKAYVKCKMEKWQPPQEVPAEVQIDAG